MNRYWYPVCIVLLIIYFVLLTHFVVMEVLKPIKDDPSLIILLALLFVVPSYIAVMIAQYNVNREKRRDLTHVIFMILIGLIISLFFTIHDEWVPSPETVSTVDFDNMSVSVQKPSPWLIPIRSAVDELNQNIFVTIRNYTSIDPVSVSMSPPTNTIFEYKRFTPYNRSDEYSQRSKAFIYNSTINARHTGMIFNSTNEYVINIDYRNISKSTVFPSAAKLPLPKNFTAGSSLPSLRIVNITNITASEPINKSQAVDNNLNTRWSAFGDRHSITFSFDKGYDVSIVGIAFYKGNIRNASFEINGQLFNSSGNTLMLQNFTLKSPQVNTKSLQIVGHGNTIDMWNSFTEVKIYGKPTFPTIVPVSKKPDATIYHASIPFQWTIRMTDLSLTTYFWIVMTGVVSSRFMSLILTKIEGPRRRNKEEFENNIQTIGWQDALGILFSFIIALVLFSSFKQANTLTTTILFNISIAFAFGFGFDKTLEVAPRFDPRFSLKRRDENENEEKDVDVENHPKAPGNEEPPQPSGNEEPPQPSGNEEPPQPSGNEEPPQPPPK